MTDQAPTPPQWGQAPTIPPPPSGLMRNPTLPGAIMAGLGGLLITVGSFLPWLTATAPLVGTMNVNGMQGGGDGIITLVLGVLTVLIAAVGVTAMPDVLRLSIITGVITVVVAILAYNQAQDKISGAKQAAGEFSGMFIANVGAGIYVLFVGAGFAILGGLLVRKAA
jgi:hypothetical protein